MSCKFFSLSMYDYIRNRCLHYIDELELVTYLSVFTVAWWIPSGIIIHHRSNAYEFFLLVLAMLLCRYCCHFCYCYTAATVVTLLLLVTVATVAITLLCYWYFSADTKSFRCGWIDNSTTNTWEYSLASPCVESINLGWILYPRKLLQSPILVGYQPLWPMFNCCCSLEHTTLYHLTWQMLSPW